MAARKNTKNAVPGTMSSKTTINKETDNSRTVESRAERYKRRELEKTASHNGSDQDKSRPMSRRSSGLGKRKREQEDDEIAEQAGAQPAEQDKECTVCLEVVTKTYFPAIEHADGEQHSSDVCLACWDQHIEKLRRHQLLTMSA